MHCVRTGLALLFAITGMFTITAQSSPPLADYYRAIDPRVIDGGYRPKGLASLGPTHDISGDGNLDLVMLGADYPSAGATSYTPQPGRVYLGDGDGGFTIAPADRFPVNTLMTVHPRKLIFADLNGDQRSDMFVANHGWDTNPFPGEQNRLYLSRPDGGWRDATDALPQLVDYTHSAAVGDLSGRGVQDLFVHNGYAGQPRILPYMLLNSGSGQFQLSRTGIPAGPGETIDTSRGRNSPGATLTDLDGDGLPELIYTADASDLAEPRLRQTMIFWNRAGAFSEADRTAVPKPASFNSSHIDLDAQAADVNGDGRRDVILCGTQGRPFYDGWFVQILINRGDHQFSDETANLMSATDAAAGIDGTATSSPWPVWVKVLDYNGDGWPDFTLQFNNSGIRARPNQPLIWLNSRDGRFTTLKVSDFVAAGRESQVSNTLLTETRNGFSFITPQYQGSNGLVITGLLATRPYRPGR